MHTSERILESALVSFGSRGYDGTSLDALASDLGVRKQTVLYHFGSKEGLVDAVIDAALADLLAVLEAAVERTEPGWERIEALVRAVFRLGTRRPELLGLLREVSRLGDPQAGRLAQAMQPLAKRATDYLEEEMRVGRVRLTDARLLLVSVYSTVVGVATSVEVLRVVGVEPTLREAVRRRQELLRFLRAAL